MKQGGSGDSVRHLAMAAALFGVITAWRFQEPDPLAGIGFLYVVPIAAMAVRFGLMGGAVAATTASALTVWLVLTNGPISAEAYFTRGTAFFAVALVVGQQVQARARERAQFESQLRSLAIQDKLSGLANRRGWEEHASAELQRAARSGKPAVVAMIDLDNLKTLNDTQGHAAGDRLLVACAAAWSGAIRDVDFLARLGGDEFALLLPECELADAAEVVARMRFATRKGHTFSVGLAEAGGGESVDDVMERADAALYEAKRAGRAVTRAARPPKPVGI